MPIKVFIVDDHYMVIEGIYSLLQHGQTQPGPPSIVSTVKINQAGFTEMMDTEVMFRKWFAHARASRLLP